jgi:Fic family protein
MPNKVLNALLEQKKSKLKGNLYHNTQIMFSYNTNHIEGSKLTEEETRIIFETNTTPDCVTNIDDIIETTNHFMLFDYMLDHYNDILTEELIKKFHFLLKRSTSDERKEWFNVGEYKILPNEVSGLDTTDPDDVSKEIIKLLNWYNNLEKITVEDIIEFHYLFESIHPFQDGNGRVGRIILFKECLKNDIIPFIIDEEHKLFYYKGFKEYKSDRQYLIDTCLSCQDEYIKMADEFLGD